MHPHGLTVKRGAVSAPIRSLRKASSNKCEALPCELHHIPQRTRKSNPIISDFRSYASFGDFAVVSALKHRVLWGRGWRVSGQILLRTPLLQQRGLAAGIGHWEV